MKELYTTIVEKLNEFEKDYSKKLLVGYIPFTKEEFNYMEKQFLASYNGYLINETVNKERSLLVSLYIINYVKLVYRDKRLWEDLADYLNLDEDIVRNMTIEAMTRTYKSRKWFFYTSKRNEYVETIRTHGILGNDLSGDRIIYALYLVYLKDFNSVLTKEKLELFFPYLDKIFRHISEEDNDSIPTIHSSIAYVRGQLPKSFLRAHLVNKHIVNDFIKMIFSYFDNISDKRGLHSTFDKNLFKKLKQSFINNNDFKNEYTLPYLSKNTPKQQTKEVVYYYNKTTQVNIPPHFIDFYSHEKKEAEIIFFEDKKPIKSFDLNVHSGGIGWKTEARHYKIKMKQSHFRYIIQKKESKEVIYDSKNQYYKNRSPQIDELNDTILLHYPERIEKKKLSMLKSGYLYSVPQKDNLKIKNTFLRSYKDSIHFVMLDKVNIFLDDIEYSTKNKVDLLTINNLIRWPNVKVLDKGKEYPIYKGSFLLNLLLRYPYELSNIDFFVNNKRVTGLDIRHTYLSDVNIKGNGDFLYSINLSELMISNAKNQIEIQLSTQSANGVIAKLAFYYNDSSPVPITHYSFNNRNYFLLEDESEYNLLPEQCKGYNFMFSDGNKSISLSLDKIKKETIPLNINDFERLPLYNEEGNMVTDKIKEKLIEDAYDYWYLELEDYLLRLTESISIKAFLQQLMNSEEQIKRTLSSTLKDVDKNFIELFINSLVRCLKNEKNDYIWFEEKYIIPYLERWDVNQLPEDLALIISDKLNSLVQSYEDISVQLTFQIIDELENEQSSFSQLFYQYSKHRRDIAKKLYGIASNFRMDQRQTIQAIKEVSRFNSSRDSMDYYEIVLNFKEMLEDKVFELPNIPYRIFIDMLIYFAIDYNAATLVDFMNLLEVNVYHSSQLTDDNKQYIRSRLLNICEEIGIRVEAVPEETSELTKSN